MQASPFLGESENWAHGIKSESLRSYQLSGRTVRGDNRGGPDPKNNYSISEVPGGRFGLSTYLCCI
jgi:hypothetical protein